METGNDKNIRYKGVLIEETVLRDLSDGVQKWLNYYKSLPSELQKMVNYEPPELTKAVTGKLTKNTKDTVFIAGLDAKPPDTMYDAKGMLVFIETYWNDQIRIEKANCYAHAMHVIVAKNGDRLQPGEINGRGLDSSILKMSEDQAADMIKNYVLADVKTGKFPGITEFADCPNPDTAILKQNQYKIALVVAPQGDTVNVFFDYHWYKQAVDKKWSHKPGLEEARQIDGKKKRSTILIYPKPAIEIMARSIIPILLATLCLPINKAKLLG